MLCTYMESPEQLWLTSERPAIAKGRRIACHVLTCATCSRIVNLGVGGLMVAGAIVHIISLSL